MPHSGVFTFFRAVASLVCWKLELPVLVYFLTAENTEDKDYELFMICGHSIVGPQMTQPTRMFLTTQQAGVLHLFQGLQRGSKLSSWNQSNAGTHKFEVGTKIF